MRLKASNFSFKLLERYYKKRILKPSKFHFKCILARGYRYILDVHGKVCFIGITGSCGKTTTTELIAAILARQGRVQKRSHQNTMEYIAETILTVSPWHRFCVNELCV